MNTIRQMIPANNKVAKFKDSNGNNELVEICHATKEEL